MEVGGLFHSAHLLLLFPVCTEGLYLASLPAPRLGAPWGWALYVPHRTESSPAESQAAWEFPETQNCAPLPDPSSEKAGGWGGGVFLGRELYIH